LARAKLGWAPNVALDEGLGRTIAYFERLLALDAVRRKEGVLL
jgi:nucleoside-diphosphate-sugar epimerase